MQIWHKGMTTYDTRETSIYEIESDIVGGALAHGTIAEEILKNAGSINAAAQAIADYYTDQGADAEFIDQDGDPLPIIEYARSYFARLLPSPLTPAEVAARFGVHPATVTKWCRDGLLPGASKRHDWSIPAEALANFQPPARGPRPAADRRRLLDQAREMVETHPELLDSSGTFYSEFDDIARELAGDAHITRVNLERARRALAHAIMQARGERR